MSISHADAILAELETAIQQTLGTSSFANPNPAPEERQRRLAQLSTAKAEKKDASRLYDGWHSAHFRSRVLPPDVMMKTLIAMEGGPLRQELRAAHLDVHPSAFVQRRDTLQPGLFSDLLENFYRQRTDERLYKGYRVLAADGVSIRMQTNPSSRFYVNCADPSQSYCAVTACPLYDVLNHTFVSCAIGRDEIGGLLSNLAWLDTTEPTIIVGDRAYSSYYLCERIRQHDSGNLFFLIRTKNGRSGMKIVKELPMEECDRECTVTISTNQADAKRNGYVFIQTHSDPNRKYSDNTRNGRWSYPSPYTMKLHIVRIRIKSGFETLLTSLPSSFTPEDLKV